MHTYIPTPFSHLRLKWFRTQFACKRTVTHFVISLFTSMVIGRRNNAERIQAIYHAVVRRLESLLKSYFEKLLKVLP